MGNKKKIYILLIPGTVLMGNKAVKKNAALPVQLQGGRTFSI
jgi:hypothetical protein